MAFRLLRPYSDGLLSPKTEVKRRCPRRALKPPPWRVTDAQVLVDSEVLIAAWNEHRCCWFASIIGVALATKLLFPKALLPGACRTMRDCTKTFDSVPPSIIPSKLQPNRPPAQRFQMHGVVEPSAPPQLHLIPLQLVPLLHCGHYTTATTLFAELVALTEEKGVQTRCGRRNRRSSESRIMSLRRMPAMGCL
jgi:hypothetical protein